MAEGNVIIPGSKKDGGKPKVFSIPNVVQRFMFVDIKGTSPLIMDRKSPRIIAQIRWNQLKGLPGYEDIKKKAIEFSASDPTPQANFFEAIWQHGMGKAKKVKIVMPFAMPGKDPDEFKIEFRPGFPTSGMKKAIVESAKKLVAAKLAANTFPGLVKSSIHVQGTIYPIEFKSLMMEEHPISAMGKTVLKWLPTFYDWTGTLLVSWYHPMVTMESVHTVLANAGLISGQGVRRPERGGKNGTFSIVKSRVVQAPAAYSWMDEYSIVVEESWSDE